MTQYNFVQQLNIMAPLNIPQIHLLKLFKLTFNSVDLNFIMAKVNLEKRMNIIEMLQSTNHNESATSEFGILRFSKSRMIMLILWTFWIEKSLVNLRNQMLSKISYMSFSKVPLVICPWSNGPKSKRSTAPGRVPG